MRSDRVIAGMPACYRVFHACFMQQTSQESICKTSLSQESHLNLWDDCRNLIG
jgi:hypothetical protein